jgi:hypothetical protein
MNELLNFVRIGYFVMFSIQKIRKSTQTPFKLSLYCHCSLNQSSPCLFQTINNCRCSPRPEKRQMTLKYSSVIIDLGFECARKFWRYGQWELRGFCKGVAEPFLYIYDF